MPNPLLGKCQSFEREKGTAGCLEKAVTAISRVSTEQLAPKRGWSTIPGAGFSDEENSWEPYSELKDLLPLEEYLSKYPELNFLNTH